jgi:ribonuclease HI
MWKETNNKLYKHFKFQDFNQALDFINKVGQVAKRLNHHPVISNEYNSVELWLSTHEAGEKVTDKDHQFAKEIDKLIDNTEPENGSVKKVKIFTDGGSRGNPGPSAAGYVIYDEQDSIIKKTGVYLGLTTNNQAEYQGLKIALEDAYRIGAREAKVYMDSLLVVNQMKGTFKVKNRDLWPIHQAIKDQAKLFRKISFEHVRRELNKVADGEVNETLDNEGY